MPVYMLHTGNHFSWSPDGKNPNHMYKPGDLVTDDKVDLAASYPEKFAYPGQRGPTVPDSPESLEAQIKNLQLKLDGMKAAQTAVPQPGGMTAEEIAGLDKMDLAGLKAFAEDEEIDLGGFKASHPADKARTTNELRAYVKAKVVPAPQTPAK